VPDILAVNFVANGQTIRLGEMAHVTRGPADPAQSMFRVNGRDGIMCSLLKSNN
jgi:multidrug efflux pump